MDVVDGEGQADWATVAAALAPRLLRLAVMLTGSTPDAEDLMQATFARAQRHSKRIVAMAALAAYLRTVMVHEHVSDRRRRGVRTVPLSEDVRVEPGPPESQYDVWRWL